ncbi:MAG: YqgE/AlgH family protein [Opitutaceae bacterium]|nr:YqgE/AlgH family protein [Opitutaceae bacterium]
MRERTKSAKPKSLAGSLLLAHPVLRDPNFRRTVILMSAHDKEGAMGVVLNRPVGRRLGELNGDFSLGPLASVPVFRGGPVQAEQLILAAWQTHDEGFKLYFGIEPEKAAQLAAEEAMHLRAFLGYSGWTGGQLEGELKQKTWVITSVPGDLLRHPQDDALWRAVLGGMSHEWRLLADEPEDPGRN